MSKEERRSGHAFSDTVIVHYQKTLERALHLIEDLSDAELNRQFNPTTPSIGFHLWHLARWADHLQAAIPGMTTELGRRLGPSSQHWDTAQIATKWGWDSADLGYEATGMLLDEAGTSALRLPTKDALVEYAKEAFAAVNHALQAIDDTQWLEAEREQYDAQDRAALGPSGTVGSAIVVHLTHTNRHLGMMECLRGVQGVRGTATS